MTTSFAAGAAALALSLSAIAALATPPVAAVKPVTDAYFGQKVIDPYRYMEDLSAPEVQQWAKAQSDETRAVLDAIAGRARLLARIAELEASVQARVSRVQRLPGDIYFYEKRGASDNQFKVYVRYGLHGADRLLIDPDALTTASGSPHAVTFYSPSPSGKLLAYGLSEGGTEEASIHVLDVATLKELITPIDRAHYSGADWMPDASGFFYLRQRLLDKGTPETEKYQHQTSFFHSMNGSGPDRPIIEAGTATSIEIAAAEFPTVTPVIGTRYTIAIPGNGVQNELTVYVTDTSSLAARAPVWRKLFDRSANVTNLAIHGDDMYLLSHDSAPRFKVLKTSVSHPDLDRAEVITAPGREVVVDLQVAKDGLYILSRDGTVGKLYRLAFTRGAKPQPVALPREGSVKFAAVDARVAGVVLAIGSWTRDFGYYAYDTASKRFSDTGLQSIGPFGMADNMLAKEVLVKASDGVDVPLSIVYPKTAKLDGSNPTELYGYGSYGITDDPFYVPRVLAWYELGGIRATCHVRGGGAYGEEWHLAGKLATKPNTWNDFIACAEYLVKEGYTSTAKLAIHGGSAGGILVGRAMTARPDLFAVAVPEVGVLNVLRAETSANGIPNIPEFGTVTNAAQFPAMLEMDALSHVKDGVKYPATLLVTGINDPRVPPWETLKMAARLQAASASGKPVLLRIDYASGHGVGSTKSQRQEQYADMWAFMLWQFGDPRFQPAR